MKKIFLLGIIVVLLLSSSLLILKLRITGNTTYGPVRMGYCPTMGAVAEKISSSNQGIELLEQSSSEEAIKSLKSGLIDVALIGRLAKESEINNAGERIISPGYTLVTRTKRLIPRPELASVRVHTSLNREIAEQLLPGNEIIYDESTSDALIKGIDEAVLIYWNDFKENHELLVVIDNGQKAKEFRIPVLYSLEYDLGKIKVEA